MIAAKACLSRFLIRFIFLVGETFMTCCSLGRFAAHCAMRMLVSLFLVSVTFAADGGPDAITPTAQPSYQAVKVELKQLAGGWQLFRDGKPYVIKGAGGADSLALLAKCGGNSIRTWSADNLQHHLDAAQACGLTVTVGLWLGQPAQGFDYGDPVQVGRQMEQVRKVVYRYRNHPAVLVWCLGNESEGLEQGDDPSYWHALNDLGAMVKKLDPHHPTMTVTAEIGGERISALNEFCPDIDIHGINSYAGCVALPERYRKAGGKKPYIVTEFGPQGQWEVAKTSFGTPPEPTSTEKAAHYRLSYEKGVQSELGKLCLGSYAFLWGHKVEATATWFGMFLPDGSRLEAVDTMTEIWSGKAAAKTCPKIESLKLEGPAEVTPDTVIKATLKARSPVGDALTVKWALYPEDRQYPLVGSDVQAIFPDALVRASETGAEVKMPKGGGAYRLCVYVFDKHGGAATGNLSLHVQGPAIALKLPGQKVKLPLQILGDEAPTAYAATGYMGNFQKVVMDGSCRVKPHAGATCTQVSYTAGDGWAGVVWQDPPSDWGQLPGGYDLTGASKLTFWARGANGGETVKFSFGLLKDKKYNDTASGEKLVTLTTGWQQFAIDLKGKDLSCIKTGFVWTAEARGAQVVFYLDDVRYEP
jgi:hypothetical protein